MSVVVDGYHLTIEDVVDVARNGERVELDPKAIERIKTCRRFLEQKLEAGETMYGVNTGIGELSEVHLDENETREFQKYLIYHHVIK